MQPATVALLGVGAVGAGAAYYFLVVKKRQQVALATTAATAKPAVSTKTPVPALGLAGDHVDRKNAIAPYVLQRFGVPSGAANTVAGIAGKLDVSGYAERYISTKVPIVGTIAEAPVSILKKGISGIASLF